MLASELEQEPSPTVAGGGRRRERSRARRRRSAVPATGPGLAACVLARFRGQFLIVASGESDDVVTVDQLLAEARAKLVRLTPAQAPDAVSAVAADASTSARRTSASATGAYRART